MRRFYAAVGEANVPPADNAAPTRRQPVIATDRERRRRVTLMTWGLVPHWSPDGKPGFSSIHARAGTVDTKPAFREAFRRCLVPADGFYEGSNQGTAQAVPACATVSGNPMGLSICAYARHGIPKTLVG